MYNSGTIVKRAAEGSKTTKLVATPSPLTTARMKAQNYLLDCADKLGETIDTVLTRLVKDPKSVEAFRYYLQSKYENPFNSPVKLAFQAALSRFSDIATMAKALNISDNEALIEVESAEYDAIKNNNPDGGILPAQLQAALILMINEFLSGSQLAGIAVDTPGLFVKVQSVTGDNFNGSVSSLLNYRSNVGTRQSNNADGILINLNDYHPDLDEVDTSGIGSGASSGGNDDNDDSGGGWDWGSIFSTINSAIGVVKNATGAVNGATNQVKNSAGTLNGVLNNIGGGIGASAINQSNLPLIIGAGFALVIIIILFVYASRK